jgi:hypothetical protein
MAKTNTLMVNKIMFQNTNNVIQNKSQSHKINTMKLKEQVVQVVVVEGDSGSPEVSTPWSEV